MRARGAVVRSTSLWRAGVRQHGIFRASGEQPATMLPFSLPPELPVCVSSRTAPYRVKRGATYSFGEEGGAPICSVSMTQV
jgi:hypothetical protein